MARRFESAVCVICGQKPAVTRDHIPPKNLFPKPRPEDLVTVPACRECNQGDSVEDEEFRTLLSFQIGKQNEKTRKMYDAAMRSLGRRTGQRQQIADSVKQVTVETDSGPELRTVFAAPDRVYDTVFARTVRGLYFHHFAEILEKDTAVKIDMLYRLDDLSFEMVRTLRTCSIGGNAFVYKFARVAGLKQSSMWLMQLYESHWVLGQTGDVIEDD